MNSICPICNGFDLFLESCPHCGNLMKDGGRLEAYFDDYSPYREIDDIKLTNGFPDVANRQCVHVGYCPQCEWDQLYFIKEHFQQP